MNTPIPQDGSPVFKRINIPTDLIYWVIRRDHQTRYETIMGTFAHQANATIFAATLNAAETDPRFTYVTFTPEPDRRLILKYRAPGARPGTSKWATRPVADTREAIAWMNANPAIAGFPAFVETRGWRPNTVAILGGAPLASPAPETNPAQ